MLLKKGDIYEAIVETIDFPNKGILHIDGERVVVKNTIPGQKIRCVITKKRKGKAEARALEIMEHSPAERPDRKPALILGFAGDAYTKACPTRNS